MLHIILFISLSWSFLTTDLVDRSLDGLYNHIANQDASFQLWIENEKAKYTSSNSLGIDTRILDLQSVLTQTPSMPYTTLFGHSSPAQLLTRTNIIPPTPEFYFSKPTLPPLLQQQMMEMENQLGGIR